MCIFSKMRWIAASGMPHKVRLFFYTHAVTAAARVNVLNNFLLIRLHYQICVFGMTFEVSLYERAIDFYGYVVGAGVV
jgi:hypothetical protein